MRLQKWIDELEQEIVDNDAAQAMQNDADPAESIDPVGGISLNENNLTINIKVDGEGMPLPVQFQDPAMINIQGLSPVIRSIAPVSAANLPVLSELGAL